MKASEALTLSASCFCGAVQFSLTAKPFARAALRWR